MEGKIAIFLGIPVETRDVSWRHDRRHDVWSCAARMRNRGTRTKNNTRNDEGSWSKTGQIAAKDLNYQPTRAMWKKRSEDDPST